MLAIHSIIAFINFCIGLYIVSNKRSLPSLAFAGAAVSSGLWILSGIFARTYEQITIAYIGFYLPVLMLLFLLIFIKTLYKKSLLSITPFMFTAILLLLLLLFTDTVIADLSIPNGIILVIYGKYIIIHKLFIISSIIMMIFLLIRLFKSNRSQISWLLFGISASAIPAMITNMLLPQVFYITDYNQYGPLFSIFMLGATAYAITKHNLMDIRVVIQRGLIYTLLTFFIISIFSILLFISEYSLGKYMNISHSVSGIITTLIGIIYGQRLLHYFTEKTNKLFYKHPYNFREALSHIETAMHGKTHKEDFMRTFVTTLNDILKIEKIYFTCISDNHVFASHYFTTTKDIYSSLADTALSTNKHFIHFRKQAQRHPSLIALHHRLDIEIIAPIQTNGSLIGYICFGKRLSGDPYTKKDIKLITLATGYAGVAMTNIRLFEEQKQYTENLERKVLERTSELENLQESQKQSMLDISHGIQGPLTLLRAEIESKQIISKEELPHFDTFIKLVDKTSSTAYELVTLARLNTLSSQQLIPKNINISALITALIPPLKQSAASQKVQLIESIDTNIMIQGAEGDIKRLIMNLVKNAIKYTSIANTNPKNIHITLTKDSAHEHALITVTDTGIGIPRKSLPKLFDTFYRVDDTVSVDGAGIGLTICKKIVDAHGGSITIESTLGDGATFCVSLPLLMQS